MASEIRFSQDTAGKHYITVGEAIVEMDFNTLSVEELGVVINGLANIMSTIASLMYKLEYKDSGSVEENF